jgi:nitrite reductase (NADH) large subunit
VRGADADVVAFRGTPRVRAVEMRSGTQLTADVLVAVTSLRPNTTFLGGSGIQVDWGVLVDDYQRTSWPDVYAAGDVAVTKDRFTGERYVHAIFPNAVEQGRIVTYNLLGHEVAYESADNMNSLKHRGLPIMAVGQMEGEELRASHDDTLRRIYLQDGRIVGFRLTGDVSSAGICRRLMNRGEDVSAYKHRLLDQGFGMGYVENLASAVLPPA